MVSELEHPAPKAFALRKRTCSHHPSIYITESKISGDCRGEHCTRRITYDTPANVRSYLETMKKSITYEQVLGYKNATYKRPTSKPYFSGNNVIIGSRHCPAIAFGTPSIFHIERDRYPYIVTIPSKTLVISMGMGSGKTHAFMKWVSQQIIQNPDFSVLIISARISFTNSIQEDCERVGVPIASYLDFDNRERFKKIREQQRIIMQLDSLYMIDPNKTFDVVFLDEIQSLTAHFSAKTLKSPLSIKRRFENSEISNLCGGSRCDYNSSKRSKMFLSSYRNNIYEIRSYHNVDTKTYFQLHEKQKLISIILEALSKNHKVAVPSNSKKFIVTLETIVHEKYPNKRCKAFYNSDDGKHTYDETVKKDELAQLDILMYSPSVGPGVSFDFTMDIVGVTF